MKTASRTLIAAFAWALAGAAGHAQTPTVADSPTDLTKITVPEDPAIRRGVLANGLRYLVMHADKPKGGLAIRLAIEAGSFEEAEGERGVAHFVEHMAFRSTRDFPNDSVDGAFAGHGIKFGRDLNAETGLFSTQFQLDLPDASDAALGLELKWLRDVADGVVFEPTALDKERGVVLAEMEASNSPEAAAETAVRCFQAPALRSVFRDPIGDEGVLKTATPDLLRSFYQRWYRPDNAIVAMVGDLPLDVLEAKVKGAFATWRADGEATAHAPRIPPPADRGLDTVSFSRPVALDDLRVCYLGPAAPKRSADVAAVRTEALGQIWREALNARLGRLRTDAANDLIGAQVEVEDNGGDLRATCLNVLPSAGQWAPALNAAELALRRFRDVGPTDLEVDAATDAVRSHLRGDITEAPNRTAGELADTLVEAVLHGHEVVEPRQALKAFDLAVEDLSVADVRAAFARDWRGAGPLISAVAASPPTADALRAAWTAVEQGAAPAALAETKAVEWDYTFGKAGDIVSREAVAMGDFGRIRFRNGVRLNFKQTGFEKNSVALVIRFGAGRREIASHDILTATLGATVFILGGVGKYGFEDLQRMFPLDPRKLRIEITDDAFLITEDVSTPNLVGQLKLLTAYMSDPGFRPAMDPILRAAVDATYRLAQTSPQLKAGTALDEAAIPGSPLTLPPKSALDGLDAARVARVLRASVVSDPIDVTLVGDIDEKTAIEMVASTFGALPTRASPVQARADVVFLRFPKGAPQAVRTAHDGGADKALAQAVWPLYVATRTRRREECAIDVMAAIFNDELRRRVRVELGKSYAPSVRAHTPDDADQGQLIASVESHPADVTLMLSEIRATADRLRGGGITQEQVDAARAPLLAENRAAMNTNARWAMGLSGSALDDQNLRDVLNFGDLFTSVRLDDVKKAAADWLTAPPWTVVVEPSDAAAARP